MKGLMKSYCKVRICDEAPARNREIASSKPAWALPQRFCALRKGSLRQFPLFGCRPVADKHCANSTCNFEVGLNASVLA